jgi:SOS-response transcriptional repressor LexA
LSFIDKIDEYLKQHKMSQSEFERANNLSKSLVSKWRKGSNPRSDTLREIADFMGISADDLMSEDAADLYGTESIPDNWSSGPDVVRDASLRYIPVYRSFSHDAEVPDPDEIEMHFAVLPDNIKSAENCFGFTIKDSSMAPEIEAGDTVIIRSDPEPDTGDIVLVNTPGENAFCRKLIRQGDLVILQPFNSRYDAQAYTTGELEMLPVLFRGKVVAIIRAVRSSSNSVPEL